VIGCVPAVLNEVVRVAVPDPPTRRDDHRLRSVDGDAVVEELHGARRLTGRVPRTRHHR
jgi:hypothetical protein